MFYDNICLLRVTSKMGVILLWRPATVRFTWLASLTNKFSLYFFLSSLFPVKSV